MKIFNGPPEIDGSPTYNIYDPLKGTFYKISWKEYTLFQCFDEPLTAAELAAKISRNYPVDISKEEVSNFFSQAYLLGLLSVPHEGKTLHERNLKSKKSWYYWIIQNYLFLRVPLFRPDAFLTKTLPFVKFLGSRPALILYAFTIIIGFVLLLTHMESFFNTFYYFFNVHSIILLAVVFSCVKCIHELAHAYVAKNFGLYVPTIGIGFLLFWPVFYTDVTEGWKLQRKKEKFLISSAGIAAELVIASLATIGWSMSSSGLLQSLFFMIATTTWFTTLIININPAVRFDGYYILGDIWGIDNLMPRAFRFTQWKFHQLLFGIDLECPEMHMTRARAAGFIFYSIFIIVYRIFLYTAIALFVYYQFTKILGIFLFLAEIWIFFLMPILWETKALYRLRSKIKMGKRTFATATLFLLLAIWFFLPWPHQITLAGVIVPASKQVIYAPENGKIQEILAENGQEVAPEEPLIRIASDSLGLEIDEAAHQHKILNNELLALYSSPEAAGLIAQKKAQVDQNEQLILGLSKRKEKLNVQAETSGKIFDWNTRLKIGQYVYEGEKFGSIADPKGLEVLAFAKETDIDYLKAGQKGKVFILSSTMVVIDAVIEKVDRTRVNELIYPSLASIYKGPLAVVPHKDPKENTLLLHDSYFLVRLAIDANPQAKLYLGQSVEVKTRGPPRSYFIEMMKFIYRVLFKESSF